MKRNYICLKKYLWKVGSIYNWRHTLRVRGVKDRDKVEWGNNIIICMTSFMYAPLIESFLFYQSIFARLDLRRIVDPVAFVRKGSQTDGFSRVVVFIEEQAGHFKSNDLFHAVQVSISPTLYKQLLCTNVFFEAFMCWQFGFVIFWQKAQKLLIKCWWNCFNVACHILPPLFTVIFLPLSSLSFHLLSKWSGDSNSHPRTMAQIVSSWHTPLDHYSVVCTPKSLVQVQLLFIWSWEISM